MSPTDGARSPGTSRSSCGVKIAAAGAHGKGVTTGVSLCEPDDL